MPAGLAAIMTFFGGNAGLFLVFTYYTQTGLGRDPTLHRADVRAAGLRVRRRLGAERAAARPDRAAAARSGLRVPRRRAARAAGGRPHAARGADRAARRRDRRRRTRRRPGRLTAPSSTTSAPRPHDRAPPAPSTGPTPRTAAKPTATSFEDLVEVNNILLDGLDPERREALVLTQLLGLPYAEAAKICRVPVGTIRSRVARAREDLLDADQTRREGTG